MGILANDPRANPLKDKVLSNEELKETIKKTNEDTERSVKVAKGKKTK